LVCAAQLEAGVDVRIGADLWALLEREAALTGVSVAQYVREAALARAA
jgi:uncharacterized protein (DUF1778 family)